MWLQVDTKKQEELTSALICTSPSKVMSLSYLAYSNTMLPCYILLIFKWCIFLLKFMYILFISPSYSPFKKSNFICILQCTWYRPTCREQWVNFPVFRLLVPPTSLLTHDLQSLGTLSRVSDCYISYAEVLQFLSQNLKQSSFLPPGFTVISKKRKNQYKPSCGLFVGAFYLTWQIASCVLQCVSKTEGRGDEEGVLILM